MPDTISHSSVKTVQLERGNEEREKHDILLKFVP